MNNSNPVSPDIHSSVCLFQKILEKATKALSRNCKLKADHLGVGDAILNHIVLRQNPIPHEGQASKKFMVHRGRSFILLAVKLN